MRFWSDDDGTTAVEYAVMLGSILLVAIVAVAALGAQSGGMWGSIKSNLVLFGLGQ
jgi:Flp pilus assembly pilin Flp